MSEINAYTITPQPDNLNERLESNGEVRIPLPRGAEMIGIPKCFLQGETAYKAKGNDMDYDEPLLYRASIVKAKKDHKCSECLRTIRKGERYETVFGVWRGGDAMAFKTCSRCVDVRIYAAAHCGDFEHVHGELFGMVEYAFYSCSADDRFALNRLMDQCRRGDKNDH